MGSCPTWRGSRLANEVERCRGCDRVCDCWGCRSRCHPAISAAAQGRDIGRWDVADAVTWGRIVVSSCDVHMCTRVQARFRGELCLWSLEISNRIPFRECHTVYTTPNTAEQRTHEPHTLRYIVRKS